MGIMRILVLFLKRLPIYSLFQIIHVLILFDNVEIRLIITYIVLFFIFTSTAQLEYLTNPTLKKSVQTPDPGHFRCTSLFRLL